MKKLVLFSTVLCIAVMGLFGAASSESKVVVTTRKTTQSTSIIEEEERIEDQDKEVVETVTTNGEANRQIIFEDDNVVVYKGKPLKLSPTVKLLTDDAPKNTRFIWFSSDDTIVTVTENGSINAKSAGTAVVTVTAKDDESITCSVNVEARLPVQSITINEKNVSVIVGSSKEAATTKLSVTIKPENAYHQTGTWSSSNEKIAMVDEEGNVQGLAVGTATISFTSDDPNEKVKAQTTIHVNQAVTKISLSDSSVSIDKGKSVTLKATVLPKDASSKKMVWSSSNEKVATVNSSGTITAKEKGKTTIRCAASDGSGIYSECQVSVITMVKSLSSEIKDRVVLFEGESKLLSVTTKPSDASDKSIKWSTSDALIASVDEDGYVKANKKGTCVITATAKDGSKAKLNFNITVEPANPISLESLGFGVYQQNLLGLTVKNLCKTKTIKNFDFDITLTSGWSSESGSYNLGDDVTISSGTKKTIKRNLFGVGYARSITITITGVKFSDGTFYSIPYLKQETWTFTR